MTTPTDLLPAAPNEVFKPGAFVRSYDFPGHWECFIEGHIEGYGGDVFPSDVHYRIAVTRRVWEGREVPAKQSEKVVYPPMRGSLGRRLVYLVAPVASATCLHCGQQVQEVGGKYPHDCKMPNCTWDDWKAARDL